MEGDWPFRTACPRVADPEGFGNLGGESVLEDESETADTRVTAISTPSKTIRSREPRMPDTAVKQRASGQSRPLAYQ